MPYQAAAVKIAAHHIEKRGGVMIGDVVGLGKTLVGTAISRVFDERGYNTLIICPKNLVKMWESYRAAYRMHAEVMSVSRVIRDLKNLRRYRLVIIDESHNLRNREGKRYRAIRDYIEHNESKVVMLTATPYNKSYIDLSNQLRLFIPEDQKLTIRPEQLQREIVYMAGLLILDRVTGFIVNRLEGSEKLRSSLVALGFFLFVLGNLLQLIATF